jgi:YidC/Oxa1 family membrane protein insertase
MPKHKAESAVTAAASAVSTQGQTKSAASGASSSIPISAAQPANETFVSADSKTYDLENDLVKISFSDIGGVINSYLLKNLEDSREKGKALELIPNKSSFTYLALNSPDYKLENVKWKYEGTRITEQGSMISFSRFISNGVKVTKSFSIMNKSYVVQTDITIANTTNAPAAVKNLSLEWGPNIQYLPSEMSKRKDGMYAYNRLMYPVGKDMKKIEIKTNTKEDKITILPEKPEFIAYKDLYFTATLKAEKGTDYKNAFLKEHAGGFAFSGFNLNDIVVDPKKETTLTFSSYIGPQEYMRLKKEGLSGIVDLGWPRFLGIWMFQAMQFFFKLTKNYGLAILLLTLLVRLILWIPSDNSYKHMKDTQKKMTIIKPRLETLKKIYKDDAQKLNEEMMKLYQEYKINPFGGCLPMLLQLPIFIALYQTLINMVELKGANFALWWTDLSKPDKFYVLPVFMGVTMFIQQKMSAASQPVTDESAAQQQKIMMYGMPIFLTFLSFQWPSGLLLYWGMSNCLAIIQQVLVNSRKD